MREKMRTSFKTRKGRRAVILTALVLAVVIAVSGTAAAYASYGIFRPMVCGVQDAVDGLVTASTAQTIGFKNGANGSAVFSLQQNAGRTSYAQYIRAIKISSDDMGTGTALQLNLDTTGSTDSRGKWSSSRSAKATTYTYKLNSSSDTLRVNDFNNLMSQLSVTFNSDAHVTSGKGTVSISAYKSVKASSDDDLIATKVYSSTGSYYDYYYGYYYDYIPAYTCKFIMYNYAGGAIDGDDTTYSYKNSYASDYGQSYNEAMAEAKTNGATILADPDNTNQGKFDFNIQILPSGGVTDNGKDYGYTASVGYQIQEAGGSWDSSVKTYWLKNDGSYAAASKNAQGAEIYTDVKAIDLKDVDEKDLIFPVSITQGLSYGTTYEVHGVIATDKKCSTPITTNEVTFRYDPPSINNLKIGSTATTYGNLEKTMDLSMQATFADKNSATPQLKATLYFTDNLDIKKQNDQGEVIDGVDNSTWIEFTGNMQEMDGDQRVDVLDSNGKAIPITKTVTMLDEDGQQETTLKLDWDNFLLPTKLSDVNASLLGTEDDHLIGSEKCAIKLVVTDLNETTEFSTFTISDAFTIDAAAPTVPTVYVGEKRTVDAPNDYDHLTIEKAYTKGGADATVLVNVDGSTDDASGVREYQYAYYYLPSDAVNRVLDGNGVSIYGADAQAIFQTLSEQTFTENSGSPTDARFVDIAYNTWAATSEAKTKDADGKTVNDTDLNGNAYGQITVGKDGFYRLIVKAVDNANRESDTTEAYLRVDLSQPNPPTITLAKADKDGNLTAYDNSTYSNANVWLYAYSTPKTGKSIADFEFSTDGGLTWTPILGRQLDESTNSYVKTTVTVDKETYTVQDYLPSGYLDAVKAEYKARNNTETLPASSVTAAENTVDSHYWPLETPGTVLGNAYQIGLNVSGMGYNDYTQFLVRAVDSLGNVSASSNKNSGIIRTTPSTVKPAASMTHDNIEVALAIGNTTLSVDDITPDLKNRAAQKINNKYYWGKMELSDDTALKSFPTTKESAEGFKKSSNATENAKAYVNFNGEGMNWTTTQLQELIDAEVFNPYIYIMTYGMRDDNGNKLDRFGNIAANYNKTTGAFTLVSGRTNADTIVPHKCTWGSDATCSGPCYLGSDCPYAKLEKLGYSVYKPENVGVSGMSSAGSEGLTFYHFDHRDIYTNNAAKTAYKVFTNSTSYNGNTGTTYDGAHPEAIKPLNDVDAYKVTYTEGGVEKSLYTAANHWVVDSTVNQNDSYVVGGTTGVHTDTTATVSKFIPAAGSKGMKRRALHLVSFADTAETGNYNAERQVGFKLNNIRTYGYYQAAPKDWSFVYLDKPAKKEIAFSINDHQLSTHSNDGYGFFWNTTQRQNKAGTWVISGYLFYIFNRRDPSGSTAPYSWGIAKLSDFPMTRMMKVDPVASTGSRSAFNASAASGCDNLGLWFDKIGKDVPSTSIFSPIWYYDSPLYYPAGNANGQTKGIRHFHMVTSGNTTKIYVYMETTNTTSSYTSADALQEKFNKDTNSGKTVGATSFTTGFRAINFKTDANSGHAAADSWFAADEAGNYDYTTLYTTRPTVDGQTIGNLYYTRDDLDRVVNASTAHTDTNCYGFGFIVGANGHSHACGLDTQIVFSNVAVNITQVKSLSDVVTEPSWGNGKAKFIANITDNAVSDFTDPVMNSQIQWRLNNDQAKYIGWGVVDNKEATYDFLDSMATAEAGATDAQKVEAREAVGTYQPNDFSVVGTGKNTNTRVTYTQQIDGISTYITKEYFEAFGLDAYQDGPIADQVQSSAMQHGHVYNIDDVDNIVFDVDPEDYKSTSANPDFPAGRWYMVHDVTGYTNSHGDVATPTDNQNVEIDPRSGAFTDALETNVSLPGRYTYYFAPDKNDDGTVNVSALNPANAVFDFVVNQSPVAAFSATVKDNKLTVTDNSYDPDARDNGDPEADGYVRRYAVTAANADVTPKTGNANSFVMNGITKWEWRFEILAPGKSGKIDSTGTDLITVMSSEWISSTDGASVPINNKSLKDLIDKLPTAKQTAANTLLTNSSVNNFSDLPDKAVVNVYLRVTDQSSYKVVESGAAKYAACPNSGQVSSVTQVSASAKSDSADAYPISNPPSTSMTFSKLYMYDTANTSTSASNKQITVERTSTHSQPGAKFGFVWKIGRGNDAQSAYKTLIPSTTTVNGKTVQVYAMQTAGTDKMPTWNEATQSFTSTTASGTQTIPVLYQEEAPTSTGDTISGYTVNGAALTTSKGGKWIINYDFINAYISSYKDDANLGMILQLNEVVWGYSANSVLAYQSKGTTPAKSAIITPSARTIFYKTDKNAPSPQVVTTSTLVAGKDPSSYAASEYLDVTDGTSFIQFSITGAEDMEGKAQAYGYYLYDANDAGTEIAWYKLASREGDTKPEKVDPDTYMHTLTTNEQNTLFPDQSTKPSSVTEIEYRIRNRLRNNLDSQLRATTESQYRSEAEATHNNDTAKQQEFLDGKVKEAVDKAFKDQIASTITSEREDERTRVGEYLATKDTAIPVQSKSASETIKIGKGTMRSTPTDSLNLAIFAYDTQTSRDDTATKANQTTFTRFEDIKLSVSNPLPPEITVKDNSQNTVATIDNIGSYSRREEDQAGLKERLGDAEYEKFQAASELGTQDSDTGTYSSSGVTVSFKPKKMKYYKNSEGNLVRGTGTGAMDYYEDIYAEADLTGKADIVYTGRYWTAAGNELTTTADLESALGKTEADRLVYGTVSEAETLEFTHDGTYAITAYVKNGSGTRSVTRTVSFTIDQAKPTGLQVEFLDQNSDPYLSNTWAQTVRATVSGATDTSGGVYEYSLDNGKSFTTLGGLGTSYTLTIPDKSRNIASGQYNLVIRARDRAGNTSATPVTCVVKVDNAPPETNPVTLTASSSSTKVYDKYVVRLAASEGGSIWSVQDGITNKKDTVVDVNYNDGDNAIRLEFRPDDGKRLNTVTVNGTGVSVNSAQDSSGTYSYYTLTNIARDYDVAATFVDDTVAGTNSAKTYSSFQTGLRMMQAVAKTPLLAASGDPDDPDDPDTTDPVSDPEPVVNSSVKHYVAIQREGAKSTQASVLIEDRDEDGLVAEGTAMVVQIKPATMTKVSQITIFGNGTTTTLTDADLTPVDGKAGWYSFTYTVLDETTITITTVEKDTVKVTLAAQDAEMGSFILVEDENVQATADARVYQVAEGATVNVKIDAQDNYQPVKLTVNGTAVAEAEEGSSIGGLIPVTVGSAATWINVDFKYVGDGTSFATPVTVITTGEGSVIPGPTSEDTVVDNARTKTVWVPASGSKNFTLTPASGYVLGSVTLTSGESAPVEISDSDMVAASDGISKIYCLTTDEIVESYTLQVEFLPKTYAITLEPTLGGSIAVEQEENGSTRTLTTSELKQVREGAKVTIRITPSDGYKIDKVEMIGISGTVGNVSSYTINALTNDVTVRVRFESRTIASNVTTHRITASAEGVKDGDSQLHAQGYRFLICKGIPRDSSRADEITKGWATALDTTNLTSRTDWTNWQSSYTKTFETYWDGTGDHALEPNQAYTVFVQTRDAVGNVSDPVASTCYTLANTAGTLGVENRNDAGDTVTKSVLLGVNRNGNPNHTEYRVYVDTNDTMQTPSIANYGDDDNEGWATLQAGEIYQFLVKHLEPGNRYYLQIECRNHDGKVTLKDPDEIASIMLSPAAPERGNFYFKEQPSPTGTVELVWEPVSSEVRGIQLFRDSEYLGDVYDGSTTFVDEATPYTYFADTVVKYSYAYINNGGVGSSQTAVSEEYYNALKKEEAAKAAIEDPENPTADEQTALAAASEEINKMRALEATSSDNAQLFSETLTYPRYPLSLTKDQITASSSSSGGDASGTLIVTMRIDDLYMRYQTYRLYLTAYEQEMEADGVTPKVDENGAKVYKETAVAPSVWDPGHNFYDEDGNPICVETTIYESGQSRTVAARARWTGLNSHYGYKVHVKEIRSTGIGAYGATEGIGVEGLLKKVCYVNETNFGYAYGAKQGLTTLKDFEGTWTDAEKALYTGQKDWSAPLNDGVISFNETPYVELADDPYEGNTEDHLSVDGNGNPFILVSRGEAGQNGAGQDFSIKVIAYDHDAEETDSDLYVSGTLGSLRGFATLDQDTHFAKTRDEALLKPFYVNFNARTLFTGVYGSAADGSQLRLAAYDGTTEGTSQNDIRVVVNQNTPIMEITDGPRQIIENGVAIQKDEFAQATAKIVGSPEDASLALGEVAWMVQPEQYSDLFKTKDYNVLREYLETGVVPDGSGASLSDLQADQATIMSRLTEEQKASDEYVITRDNGTGVTQKGLNVVLLSVAPPIRRYVSVSEADYTAIRATLTTEGKTAKELKVLTLTEVDSDGNTVYWLELDTALAHDLGGWLSLDEDGNVVPKITMEKKEVPYQTDRANTRVLKVVAPFGGNAVSQEISFVMKNHAAVTVKSEKVFDWVTVGQDEYDDYRVGGTGRLDDPDVKGYTVQDLLDQYKLVYNSATEFEGLTKTVDEDGNVTLTDGTLKRTDNAYRILTDEDGNEVLDSSNKPTYQVYKLVDQEGNVTTKSLTVILNADLGVNERFSRIGVLAIPEDQQYQNGVSVFDPNAEEPDETVTRYYAVANNVLEGPVTSSDPDENYFVSITNLTQGKTYYLWSFYELPDGTKEYNRSYVAMTTQKAYSTVSFGFASLYTSYAEPDFPTEGAQRQFGIIVQRETESGKKAYGSIKITPAYYQADEFGKLLKDDDGNLIPLTGDDLENAVNAIQLMDTMDNSSYYAVGQQSITRAIGASQTSDSFRLLIRNNDACQHHAVLRLTMEVVKSEEGFCQLINGSGYMDVFLQDDEDTITDFTMGVTGAGISGDTGEEFGTMEAADNGASETHFSYQYSGLQVGYGNPGTLFVNYTNTGTGDLLNITAELYDDENGSKSENAKKWFQVTPPSKSDLLRDSSTVGTVEVHPNADLADGVYTAWLIMKAENVKEEDWIRIQLTQVVGQSTLKGRIYITPGRLPKDRELVGESTILIYDRENVIGYGENQNKGDPAYKGKTDIYGNYEIPNILNGKEYYIVVERNGFITYDGAQYTSGANIDLVSYPNSRVFKFDLCLIGGDVIGADGTGDPDGLITEADLNTLNAQYGKYWSHYEADSDEYKLIKRCDFNGDGVVNSLDRAYLIAGKAQSFQSKDYTYTSLAPES